jgi:hypothetical protein
MLELEQGEGMGVTSEGDPYISRHIELPSLINGIPTSALYDPGSNASFISSSFARKHHITAIPLETPKKIGFADGDRPGTQVREKAIFRLRLGKDEDSHEEILTAFIFDIQHDLILGLPWSEVHQPQVDWLTHELELRSHYCTEHCTKRNQRSRQDDEPVQVSIVRADDLCADELGGELLYLLGYEWTLPLEVNTTKVSNAAKLSVMDCNGVWSPPLKTTAIGLNAAATT